LPGRSPPVICKYCIHSRWRKLPAPRDGSFRQYHLAVIATVFDVLLDVLQLVRTTLHSQRRLAAENLFLRKQLALYIERHAKPRRATNATRLTLVLLAHFIDWRPVLTIVQPDTLLRWHRDAFRLFWRWRSTTSGRPRIPRDLQQLIAEMAQANRTWGEERITAELLLKLGMSLSPRTVRRYMRRPPSAHPGSRTQTWSTFVRNHARDVLACDFFVTVTARFRLLYVFVVLDVGSRRLVHWNVTAHPTAEWTVQQCRTCVTGETTHRVLVHDRDRIYSPAVDGALHAMGLQVLKTPVMAPQANAYCERVIGTARRECLDWVIPLDEWHLRRVLTEWVAHYNRGRPHAALGRGLPDASSAVPVSVSDHDLFRAHRVTVRPILGGLHHEYHLETVAA
jgi:putative transposase